MRGFRISSLFLSLFLVFLSISYVQCTKSTSEEKTSDAASQDIASKEAPGRLDSAPSDRGSSARPLDAALADDEVRVGRITRESERITGPESKSSVGDWKIYNSKVAFVVHGVRLSQTWSTSSGHLIDASPIDAEGKAARDRLEELFPIVSLLRVIVAQSIEVVEPGGKGKQAILRVTAKNAGIPVIDSILRTPNIGGTITVDYILKPGVSHIEIVTRIQGDDRDRSLSLGDGVLFGDQTRWIAPKVGWKVEDVVGKKNPWLAATSEQVSYLLSPSDKDAFLNVPITQAAVFPAMGGEATTEQKVGEYRRFLFVGKGGLEDTLRAYRALRNNKPGSKLEGSVKGLAQGVKASVTVSSDQGVIQSQTWTDTKGEFSFELPAGEYTLRVQAEGYKASTQKAKTGDSPTFNLAPRAILTLQVAEKKRDGTTAPFVPCRVDIKGSGLKKTVDVIQPRQSIPLPPGSYTVTLSRSLNYEFVQKKIDLKEGQTLALQETLVEVVDTSGYISADMHLHASPSIDSEVPLERRVSALAAEGVMYAVSSDHDTWTDYTPYVQKLKLEKWLKTSIGQEVSPIGFHANGYPVPKPPANANLYFNIPWAIYKDGEFQKLMEAPEIFKYMREKLNVPIVQINHPRRGQAFLSYVKYDNKKGIKDLQPGRLDSNWDVIELYNKKDRKDFLTKTLFDFFSFLNQGWYKTGVGNSDSHSEGNRPGMARTLIASSKANPSQIDPNEIVESLKKNRAIVYGGPMIRLRVDGKEAPGARIKKASVDLQIEIQAPSWVAVSYVKLYANGKLQETYQVPSSKDRVRFKKTVTLSPSVDTWYIVMAGDDNVDMSPVYPGVLPISMTNAMFLDINGDGFKSTWNP